MTEERGREPGQSSSQPTGTPGPGARGLSTTRTAGATLRTTAARVQIGLFGAGILMALAIGLMTSATQSIRGWPLALAVACVVGVIGWTSGRLLQVASVVLDEVAERADADSDARRSLLASLERIAEALERPAVANGPPAAAVVHPREETRQAIEGGRWDRADALIGALLREQPGDPEGPRLASALAEARALAGRELRAKVDAACAVNDTERVLELRDALLPLTPAEARPSLDQELARWFLAQIQKRLRSGRMSAEVAVLAARVAERFDGTAEGASLRAALPTLRRSGGLCARCGQPYKGIADACPACLTASSPFALETAAEPTEEVAEDDEL